MIHFKILTIFPELFPGPLSVSVIGDALKNKLWSFEAINIRDYAKDKHKSVDDTPYGGGAGMVMKADVIASAIESHFETVANPRFSPFSNSTSPHKSRVQIFQKVDLRHGHFFKFFAHLFHSSLFCGIFAHILSNFHRAEFWTAH